MKINIDKVKLELKRSSDLYSRTVKMLYDIEQEGFDFIVKDSNDGYIIDWDTHPNGVKSRYTKTPSGTNVVHSENSEQCFQLMHLKEVCINFIRHEIEYIRTHEEFLKLATSGDKCDEEKAIKYIKKHFIVKDYLV